MAVHDFSAAVDFYSNKLGVASEEEEAKEDWRYYNTRRMTFELFQAHPQRIKVQAWGKGQAFRPVILVSDLAAAETLLRRQAIPFASSTSTSGAQVEMIGSEGIRWGLMESPDGEMDWAHPIVGGIEVKATNLEAQRDFYTRMMGMAIEDQRDQFIHLSQSNGDVWLHLETGGLPAPFPARTDTKSPAFLHPIWISFETQDVRSANTWLQQHDLTFLRSLTYHPDWNGTDILLADADGNVVQVVQYSKANIN